MKRTPIKRKPRPRRPPGVGCQYRSRGVCRRNAVGERDGVRYCPKHLADLLIGDAVKARDGACLRCGVTEHLQAAHVIRRGYMAVRWSIDRHDPRASHNNVITLCRACHKWQTEHPLEGNDWFREYGIDYANLRYLALHDPPQDPNDVLHWLSGEGP